MTTEQKVTKSYWMHSPLKLFSIVSGIVFSSAHSCMAGDVTVIERDVVIYGSTPAALTAAIEVKDLGRSVVIVSPETRIGGMTTGGLGQTDIGNKSAFGGLARRFYKDIALYYADAAHWIREKAEDYFPDGQCQGSRSRETMWTFEPSAALAVLQDWERRYGLEIRRGERLVRELKSGVEVEERTIKSFRTLSGAVYRGKVFVDATYEGDLMAAAGVSYVVGREGNDVYGETLNGCQPNQGWHRLSEGISPYVQANDSSSGLLPGIESGKMEPEGTGDRRVQAYCFRMCLTDDPANRIPFKKPAGYDERWYELLLRNLEAQEDPARRAQAEKVLSAGIPWINSRMPNRKTDTNNCKGQSTDFIGQNYAWAEASYEERERILQAHLTYQQGLMWTLANHPRVPAHIRSVVSKWGTCKDEFADGLGDGWQRQLYVREARRMVGEIVMTERHCRGKDIASRPVALAAYTMDSHHVRRYVGADGCVHNEGDVEVGGIAPYPIDYGAIVPKRGECANLIVPVCLSASHIAFGSIRMEPVFFALGQAAGAAAAQAVERKSAVQDVDYPALRDRLLADGQVLAFDPPGLDPIVPFRYRTIGVEQSIGELKEIREKTGLRRFLVTGPGFGVVTAPPAPDCDAQIAADVAAVRKGLTDTDIDVGWWRSPSIRYVSRFQRVLDSEGKASEDAKNCPLDPAFAADFAARIKTVAKSGLRMICIEDDFTLAWARGLNELGPCYCPRHMAEVSKRYGQTVTPTEVAAAFRDQTPANLPLRRAFAETTRDSLVQLARQVRAAVDTVDPSIRIILCQPGGSDVDGDSTEALARAFAGGTRPALRPFGAIYGAETTPADVPGALGHTLYTLERIPADIETFYETDPYPHNRFYTSAAQLGSLMAGAMMMGADDLMLYCCQYLDDPLEDSGYADMFRALKPRLAAVKDFIRSRRTCLAGVRIVWTADETAFTRNLGGYRRGQQLQWGSYHLSKFGLPYTTRPDGNGPVVLTGEIDGLLSDDELRTLLSGGILLDAPAACRLTQRGFGRYLGVGVKAVAGRLPIYGEKILPAAGCRRRGKTVNAFYAFPAGTEGSVDRFATLTSQAGAETWSVFTGLDGAVVTPSLVVSTNLLGGRVAVLATSLLGNRSSGLLNLRKQELMQNLFNWLAPDSVPLCVRGTPGIWTLAQISQDGREMLVMVNNLSGDERSGVRLAFAAPWVGGDVAYVQDSGSLEPLGTVSADWEIPRGLGQMRPEFFIVGKEDRKETEK